MWITADIKSKALKPGALKALFPKEKGKVGLGTFVGRLDLHGAGVADFALLRALYKHIFRFAMDDPDGEAGSIIVFDKDGKEVIRYGDNIKPGAAYVDHRS